MHFRFDLHFQADLVSECFNLVQPNTSKETKYWSSDVTDRQESLLLLSLHILLFTRIDAFYTQRRILYAKTHYNVSCPMQRGKELFECLCVLLEARDPDFFTGPEQPSRSWSSNHSMQP